MTRGRRVGDLVFLTDEGAGERSVYVTGRPLEDGAERKECVAALDAAERWRYGYLIGG